MLQPPIQKSYAESNYVATKDGKDNEYFDLRYIIKAARRQCKLIVVLSLIGAGLGIIYVLTSVPLFTTTASLIIDRRQVRAVQDVSAVTDNALAAPTVVDSQVEVLKSPRIALAVVDRLNLSDDTTFWAPDGSLFTNIYARTRRAVRGLFTLFENQPKSITIDASQQEIRRLAAAFRLLGKITVARVGQTYLVTVRYQGTDAKQAVRIANTYVEAYLADHIDSGYEDIRRANLWLQERLDKLQMQSVASDQMVQQFRDANNLIAVGGQLITDLQLAELNTQLSVARADVARASAQLDRIRSVIGENKNRQADHPEQPFAALIAALTGNAVLPDLQMQHLEAVRREAEIVAQFGPDHERAALYRSEKMNIEQQIFAEVARVAEGYESEYQVAKGRLETLSRSVEDLIKIVAGANDKMTKLRRLEQTADAYKSLYRSFFERYQQTIQQQTFPMTHARIITPATYPMLPSHPKAVPVIFLSALMGAMVGGAWGAVREYRDRSLRTRAAVRQELGLRCLGMLPVIPPTHTKKGGWASLLPNTLSDREPALSSLAQYVLEAPQSRFSETLRSILIPLANECPSHHSKVIGVLSVTPNEGTSLIAANLAALLAREGSHALLLDANFRKPTLSEVLAPNCSGGLLEILAGKESWNNVIHHVPGSDVHMIPTGSGPDLASTSTAITSRLLGQLLGEAAECYQYIILDLPSLREASEVSFLSSKVDCVLLVVRWGSTSIDLIRDTLADNDVVVGRCIGVVLNCVEMKSLRLYEDYLPYRPIS